MQTVRVLWPRELALARPPAVGQHEGQRHGATLELLRHENWKELAAREGLHRARGGGELAQQAAFLERLPPEGPEAGEEDRGAAVTQKSQQCIFSLRLNNTF